MSEKREQVLAQCRAVIHMAHALATVHDECMPVYASGEADELLELVGRRTARFMEQLGDMLNSMDAVDSEDEWIEPVLAEAQRLWPAHETSAGWFCKHNRQHASVIAVALCGCERPVNGNERP